MPRGLWGTMEARLQPLRNSQHQACAFRWKLSQHHPDRIRSNLGQKSLLCNYRSTATFDVISGNPKVFSSTRGVVYFEDLKVPNRRTSDMRPFFQQVCVEADLSAEIGAVASFLGLSLEKEALAEAGSTSAHMGAQSVDWACMFVCPRAVIGRSGACVREVTPRSGRLRLPASSMRCGKGTNTPNGSSWLSRLPVTWESVPGTKWTMKSEAMSSGSGKGFAFRSMWHLHGRIASRKRRGTALVSALLHSKLVLLPQQWHDTIKLHS